MPRISAPDSDDEDMFDSLSIMSTHGKDNARNTMLAEYSHTMDDAMDEMMEEHPVSYLEIPELVIPSKSSLTDANSSAADDAVKKFLSDLDSIDVPKPAPESDICPAMPSIDLYSRVPEDQVDNYIPTHRHLLQTFMEVHLNYVRPSDDLVDVSFIGSPDVDTWSPSASILSDNVRKMMAQSQAQYPDDHFTQLCNNYFAAIFGMSASAPVTTLKASNRLPSLSYSALRSAMLATSLLKALFSPRVTQHRPAGSGSGAAQAKAKKAEAGDMADGDEDEDDHDDDEAESAGKLLIERLRYAELSRWCQFAVSAHSKVQLGILAAAQAQNSAAANPTNPASVAAQQEHAAATVFFHLTSNQVEKAVEAAQNSAHPRLATLVAAIGAPVTREAVSAQIKAWRASDYWACMDIWHQRVYALLAGEWYSPGLWGPNSGKNKISGVSTTRTGTCGPEQLDERSPTEWWWVRAFALELWYGSHVTVADALAAYNQQFKKKLVSSPTPLHQSSSPVPVTDALYTLISCYITRSQGQPDSLVPACVPATLGPHADDVALAWVLTDAVCVLHQQLDDMTALAEAQQHLRALTTRMIAQLRAAELWPWAVYLAMQAPVAIEQRQDDAVGLLVAHLPSLHSWDDTRATSAPCAVMEELEDPEADADAHPDTPASARLRWTRATDEAGLLIKAEDLGLTVPAMRELYCRQPHPGDGEEEDAEAAKADAVADANWVAAATCVLSSLVMAEHACLPRQIVSTPYDTAVPVSTPVYPCVASMGVPAPLAAPVGPVTLPLDVFLSVACGVPAPWLHRVRASAACAAGRPMLQLAHLLMCTRVELQEDMAVDTGVIDVQAHETAFIVFMNTVAVTCGASDNVSDLYALFRAFFESEGSTLSQLTDFTATAVASSSEVDLDALQQLAYAQPLPVAMSVVMRVLQLRSALLSLLVDGGLEDGPESDDALLQVSAHLEDLLSDVDLLKPLVTQVILSMCINNAASTARTVLGDCNRELTRRGYALGEMGHTHAMTGIKDMGYLDAVVAQLNK